MKEKLEWAVETGRRIQEEVHKVIVGQENIVEQVLWCVFAGGHALLEGIPGLGKTMLVKTLADALDLTFSRIQFTPDLMPSDITGTQVIQGQEFVFRKGPVFGNLVLADEVNRATPKTQSALLEAMQEQTVTVAGETYPLPRPFFVLATQNPLEMDGTYPLPEAQMDRFLLKVEVPFPSEAELMEIVRRTTSTEEIRAQKVADGEAVAEIQRLCREILVADDVLQFAVKTVLRTHPWHPDAPEPVKKYVRYGSGPRGLQAMIRVAKVRALLAGRFSVSVGDLKNVALPALRHRIFLNFDGEAEGISIDGIIGQALEG